MRYSGANNLECNLYNQEGMPASPFLAGWSADARDSMAYKDGVKI